MVSSGVHDNGNIYCHLAGGAQPWHHLETGDGGWTGFMEDGGLVTNIKGKVAGDSQPTIAASSVRVPASSRRASFRLRGLHQETGLVSPFGDVVRDPSYKNAAGQLMLAAAGSPLKPADVYGLFQDGSEPKNHRERIGAIPGTLQITATGALSGRAVMVATAGGRMFLLNSARGTVSEQPVVLPKPAPDNHSRAETSRAFSHCERMSPSRC